MAEKFMYQMDMKYTNISNSKTLNNTYTQIGILVCK
jgi:hypothetical protein